MTEKTTLAQSIEITEYKSKYDAACKKVLAEKIILAWIMKHSMKEYKNCPVMEIAEKFIRGEPEIAEVPVLPDETNAPKIEITGVEDSTITEGTITYDIRFHAILPKTKEEIRMIINVEAQDDFYPGYPIIKRGIYYCSRMISAQYGTVFIKSHYEKIQKVYSIWICMNPPLGRQNTITKYSVKEENVVGEVTEEEENYDLLTAIMICLGEYEENNDRSGNQLLRMLDVLLSTDTSAEIKKQILEEEFDIPMSKKMEGDVEEMCNLGDGVEKRGIKKGIEQQRRFVVANMLKKQKTVEEICEIAGCDQEYVEKIQHELCMV